MESKVEEPRILMSIHVAYNCRSVTITLRLVTWNTCPLLLLVDTIVMCCDLVHVHTVKPIKPSGEKKIQVATTCSNPESSGIHS